MSKAECRLHFVGNGGELKKVKSFYKAIPSIPGGQPVSTNTDQPTMNSDQSAMNSDQPAMNSDQPAMNSDQPAMNSDQPAMNSDQPAMNSDQPAMNSDQPAMNSDQPAMNSDQPAMNSDQPAMNSDQPAMNSDQPAMNSDQPAMNSDQPAMNSDQPAMNSDQPAMNSDQPAMNSDQPAMNSDQPVMNSDQLQPVMNIDYLGESAKNYHCDQLSASKEESIGTAVVLKQPISDANKKQPQISLNDGALEPSKSTTQSNQFSSPQPEQSAVWATFERCVLLVSDKVLIENGEELTDKHMQFTQCIIKKQFPSIGGLHSTLLQDKPSSFRSRTANTSTKWCKDNQVAVYDSVFVRLDAETRTTIMKMFRLKKTKDIIMMPMQKKMDLQIVVFFP